MRIDLLMRHLGAQGPTADRPFSNIVLWLSLASSVALLLFGLDRGFDLTDEAYYLAWISDPTRFAASIHPFGLPIHLAYLGLGRSVVMLRLLGLLMLLATGAILGWALGRFYADRIDREFRRRLVPFGALASLGYYAFWIMTPNYNLLADASAAMILAGVLTWAVRGEHESAGSSRDHVGSVLVGLGGCLGFFAKPTFAALAALAIAAILAAGLLRNKRRTIERSLIVAVTCVVPLVVIIEASVGWTAFLSSIRIGTTVLASDNSLTNLPLKTVREFYYGSPLFAINVAALAFGWAWARDRQAGTGAAPTLTRLVFGLLLLDLLFLSWNIGNGIHIQARPWVQLGLAGVCLALGLLTAGFVRIGNGDARPRLWELWPVMALIAMPFAIAFGTLNSLLVQTGQSLFAIFLALVVGSRLVLRSSHARVVEQASVIFVPAMLIWSSNNPYDLPRSLYAQTQRVVLPFTSSVLRVDAETKRYVDDVRRISRANALTDCTPIFDLSGGGPGTSLVMNNRAPFFPWLFHMFGATGRIVDASWQSMSPEQRRTAWIVAPIHANFRQTNIARELSRRESEYRRVGRTSMIFWGRDQSIGLWRPLAPASGSDCKAGFPAVR